MIHKIVGYHLKETYDGESFYWRKDCLGYVDNRADAGLFTVRDLKAAGVEHGLRHSLKYTKRLRLVPVYEKEATHDT